VARVAMFLASDASAGITGQSINVDAGVAMN
jgi:enoyl-[acyl-carrier-protein] reductase (NADH)